VAARAAPGGAWRLWVGAREVDEDECDRLRTFAAEMIFAHRRPVPVVAGSMARAFPAATGLSICFVLADMAAEIARTWEPKDPYERALPRALFEASALLAADLFALEESGAERATGRDLVTFWGGGDGYFLG